MRRVSVFAFVLLSSSAVITPSIFAQTNCSPVPITLPFAVSGTLSISDCLQNGYYYDKYKTNLNAGTQITIEASAPSTTTLTWLDVGIYRWIDSGPSLGWNRVIEKTEYTPERNVLKFDFQAPYSADYMFLLDGGSSVGAYNFAVRLLAAGGPKQIVPIVGHVTGAGGSEFRSDLKLYNPTSTIMTGRLVFTNRGQSETTHDTSISYSIAPNAVTFFRDVYTVAFPGATGSARLSVVPDGSNAPIVDSSTYTALSDGGELAQSPTVLAPGSFMSGVQVAALGKAGERTNLFVITGSQDVTIYWKYRDAAGVQRATSAKTYVHDATHQFSVSDLLGISPDANGSLEANVVSGVARIAFSPVNNVSNQGRWLDFQRVP
jgi:hypothetical protein